MKFQMESLYQQVLQHREQLFLGCYGWVCRLGVHIEAEIAPLNPIRAGAQVLQRNAERDGDQVTEPRVRNDAAAEWRLRLLRPRPVAASIPWQPPP